MTGSNTPAKGSKRDTPSAPCAILRDRLYRLSAVTRSRSSPTRTCIAATNSSASVFNLGMASAPSATEYVMDTSASSAIAFNNLRSNRLRKQFNDSQTKGFVSNRHMKCRLLNSSSSGRRPSAQVPDPTAEIAQPALGARATSSFHFPLSLSLSTN